MKPTILKFTCIAAALCCSPFLALSQCDEGELEVLMFVETDNWGYEAYWEIVPGTNDCGDETIAWGGNEDVGCDGGGTQSVNGGGYNDNDLVEEGPWCLLIGESYTLHYIDDWGDGGAEFTLLFSGIESENYEGSNDGNSWTFTVTAPPSLDAQMMSINSYAYTSLTSQQLSGSFLNQGIETITELELQYTVNGGSATSQEFTGLEVNSNESADFAFTSFMTLQSGDNEVEVTVLSVNGGTDEVSSNNSVSKDIELGPGIPNVIDGYLDVDASVNVINDGSDGVETPRDLDFHPTLTRFELWVINKGTENSGGSTVRFRNAGFGDQNSEWEQDGNAYHFMSLPTAIAFGENENFATSPGVYDANHDGGSPFTGPSLWSSEDDIYAEPSGGNGSHLDMLHASPRCQGIAHEIDNAYWLVDGQNKDIVRYDFVDDHGPGNSYHGDAIIHRYADFEIERDPNNHIVSHCVLDKSTGWLYVVDHGNARVLRMDINSGEFGSVPAFGPFEDIQEYLYVTNYDWEEIISSDLVEPAGIDLVGDRLLVSDHATGEVVIYDMNDSFVELGRIETGNPGIMGIKVGPWGRVWFVNATTEEVGFLEGNALTVEEVKNNLELNVYPNPASDNLFIELNGPVSQVNIQIWNSQGQLVSNSQMNTMSSSSIDIRNLSPALYMVHASMNGEVISTKTFIKH